MATGKDEPMSYKWIGAACIVLSCGGYGIALAASHRREERELSALLSALDYMACELQYRLTPLPDLCRQAASTANGWVRRVFRGLAGELENQIAPNVEACMEKTLKEAGDAPKIAGSILRTLGKSLGRFDLEGQLSGLDAAREQGRAAQKSLARNRDTRLRSYETLGFCAGAAIAILFL